MIPLIVNNDQIRVVDCYLLEGKKILYRVAIALVHLWSQKRRNAPLTTLSDENNINDRIGRLSRDIGEFITNISVRSSALLNSAFSIRHLTGAHIEQLEMKCALLCVNRNKSPITNQAPGSKRISDESDVGDVTFISSLLSNDAVGSFYAYTNYCLVSRRRCSLLHSPLICNSNHRN